MVGKLFVFEGPDGVGKSTLSKMVLEECNNQGIPTILKTFPGKDDGTLGRIVYNIHHNPEDFKLNRIDSTSMQLLHVAAHIDLVAHEIEPELKKGKHIILDRFWWSTYVYGLINGGKVETINQMIELEKSFWNPIIPSILFLIDRDKPFNEQMDDTKWVQIRAEYLELSKKESEAYPIKIINNTQSIVEISNLITDNILERIQS
jgi:dTMP kinase